MRAIRGLFLSFIVYVITNLSLANDLSPTFLPMIDGEWRIISDHTLNGQKSYQACLTDEQLQREYSSDQLWQVFKENRSECQLVKNNTRNSVEYNLICQEPGMLMTILYRLIKNGYSEYILEKTLTTEPEMPNIGFTETIVFSRVGPCQQ